MSRQRKLTDKVAIELMKDINSGLKTKVICEKYKEYDLRPTDIYNIIHKDYYIELRQYV